jgi:RimJ/RimL family protein N-acetyltransferase
MLFVLKGRAMLETRRLLLRRWRDSDREPFAALNSDPRVMQHFPAVLSRAESDRVVDRIEAHFEKHGFGLFAAELRQESVFIGFVGFSVPEFEAPFTPCVEIGWRIAAEYWNQGLATEGAQAVLAYGFDSLPMDEIVSFTVPANLASRRVMEKIGMRRVPEDDFDHPNLPGGHPLRRHVLYRISAAERRS